MEKVYKPRCDKLINIKEAMSKYSENLRPEGVNEIPESYDDIKALLNITDETAFRLEESISLNNLSKDDDVPIIDFHLHDLHSRRRNEIVEIPKKAMRLRCVRNRIENQQLQCEQRPPSNKYNKYRFLQVDYDNSKGLCDLAPLSEILITVRVYEPFIYKRGQQLMRKPRLNQEFMVLGSQRLTELRDKIYCQCRYGPFLDISEQYAEIISTCVETAQPQSIQNDPGFFFITDTFYQDTRFTDTDYTVEIREWMERQPDIEPVKMGSMQDTLFQDLNLRLGFPQVYKHYGKCEHLLMFTDIRLIATDDSLKRSDYPLLRMVSSTKPTNCMTCGNVEAAFIVNNSNMHIHDPTYLCKKCLVAYHYVDGKKIGQFEVYRYFSNRPMLLK